MTEAEVNKLVAEGHFPEAGSVQKLIETHISWVILCDQFVYKIKKPVHYSFLDFSTIERRKYYCGREIELNKRLTDNIYLDVQLVYYDKGLFTINGNQGEVTDYAVRMNKVDGEKQMDVLLMNNQVSALDMQHLAKKIASFHKNTVIINEKDFLDIREKFNDLEAEKAFLKENLNKHAGKIISRALETSRRFLEHNKNLLAKRLDGGYFRDCHGDLHSRNIFLLPDPQPFDCIEFNDDFRQIDVLNEVAFLCMDLEAFNRADLSELFIKYYNDFFPAVSSDIERSLLLYYKSYRANVRAKVNSLRAKSALAPAEKEKALHAAQKYLSLMDGYLRELSGSN